MYTAAEFHSVFARLEQKLSEWKKRNCFQSELESVLKCIIKNYSYDRETPQFNMITIINISYN